MFRNQYDTDVTTWSPAGRLFQVEYAMEAVKQGSACVGLRSRTHAVLAAVNKAASELSSHQRKVFRVAEHAGVALAGSPPTDASSPGSSAASASTTHSSTTRRSPSPGSRSASRTRRRVCTQRSWKRPYGVGLLVAGLDESGAHLYYNCPSGNYFEYQAFAIGSRSQAAKTFLERRFKGFNDYTPEELIKDALSAIKETLQGEKLTSSNCTVAIVGRKDDGTVEPFEMIDAKRIQEIIDSMEAAEEAPAEPSSVQAEDGGSDAAPMDI
ncbi:hypothetical protein ACP70R_035695 [Stipagrostis hirtigluma subsp. patula]